MMSNWSQNHEWRDAAGVFEKCKHCHRVRIASADGIQYADDECSPLTDDEPECIIRIKKPDRESGSNAKEK